MIFFKLFTTFIIGVSALVSGFSFFDDKAIGLENYHDFNEKNPSLNNSVPTLETNLEASLAEKIRAWKLDNRVQVSYDALLKKLNNSEKVEISTLISSVHEQIDIAKVKISQLFNDINSNNIYHDLFTPYYHYFSGHHPEKIAAFKNKITFKLNRIIEKKIMSEFEAGLFYQQEQASEPQLVLKLNRTNWQIKEYFMQDEQFGPYLSYQPWPFEISLEVPAIRAKGTRYYVVPVIIRFIKDYQVIKTINEMLVWKNKLHYTKSNPKKKLKMINEAVKVAGTFNKEMFSDIFTGWDLLHYFKGQLEEIVLDFKIKPAQSTNMSLFFKSTDFKVHVHYKNKEVFTVSLGDNFAKINYYQNKHKDKIIFGQKNPNVWTFRTDFEHKINNLLEHMQLEYQDLWSASDNIDEITRTAKALWWHIYGADPVNKYISITTSLDPRTPLKKIIVAGEQYSNHTYAYGIEEFDFTWIFSSHKDIFKYENINTKTVTIVEREIEFRAFQEWVFEQKVIDNSNFYELNLI